MVIAQKLQNESRAEYLLYMWQIEDILRVYHCDIDALAEGYLSRFQLDEETSRTMRQWYADLCDMMRSEGKTERGHLQICNNVIVGLEELNEQLLASEKFPYFKQMYYKVLPYVVELRAKNEHSRQHRGHPSGAAQGSSETPHTPSTAASNFAADTTDSVTAPPAPTDNATISGASSELTCLFEILYGVMMLRLKKTAISRETEESVKAITAFLGQLSDYWKAYKAGKLELE